MVVTWGEEGSSESEEPLQPAINDKIEKQIKITKLLRIFSIPFHLEIKSKYILVDWDLKGSKKIRA
jgi:hypothetical protein